MNSRALMDRWYDFEIKLIGILLVTAAIAAAYLGVLIATAPDMARAAAFTRAIVETTSQSQ